MTTYDVVLMLLILILISGSVAVITMRRLIGAAILEGVVSLMAALLFLIMAAPDVAITQAVIGAGLSLVIFVFALRRMKEDSPEGSCKDE